eukprot:c16005_g1_i1 orf=211-408(-)
MSSCNRDPKKTVMIISKARITVPRHLASQPMPKEHKLLFQYLPVIANLQAQTTYVCEPARPPYVQ